MSYIKILRLKSGEDIIGFVTPDEKNKKILNVRYPLNVIINYNYKKGNQELVMSYWLPVNLLEKNEANIPVSEILLVLEVKKSFKEYYLNFLNDFQNFEEEPDEEEELRAILESLDVKELGKIH